MVRLCCWSSGSLPVVFAGMSFRCWTGSVLNSSARGVEVLAINIRDVDGAREFMASEHLRLTNLIDPDGETAQRYQVSGVPKFILIGPDGKIRRSAAGWQDEPTLRNWLANSGV